MSNVQDKCFVPNRIGLCERSIKNAAVLATNYSVYDATTKPGNSKMRRKKSKDCDIDDIAK